MSSCAQKGKCSKKILVVDDCDEMLDGIRIILEDEGYEVMVTTDSSDIPSVVKKFSPCLILLDYMMPGDDGGTIAKKLKKDTKLSKIPIIIFSASREVKEIARISGANDYISKPFDFELLLKKIEKICI